MRFTFGQFRRASRDPTFRIQPGRQSGGPNTAGTLRASVRAFHQHGEVAGETALERGLSGYFSRPENRGQADRARQMFRNYVRLSDADGRIAFDFDIAGDLVIGDDTLAVSVDLALLDPNGYAGRIMLWDQLPCDRDAAETIAGPAFQLLVNELGEGRTDNMEVWHMPAPARFAFSAADAMGALRRVPALLARMTPDVPGVSLPT
jgi:hypothetical protein